MKFSNFFTKIIISDQFSRLILNFIWNVKISSSAMMDGELNQFQWSANNRVETNERDGMMCLITGTRFTIVHVEARRCNVWTMCVREWFRVDMYVCVRPVHYKEKWQRTVRIALKRMREKDVQTKWDETTNAHTYTHARTIHIGFDIVYVSTKHYNAMYWMLCFNCTFVLWFTQMTIFPLWNMTSRQWNMFHEPNQLTKNKPFVMCVCFFLL